MDALRRIGAFGAANPGGQLDRDRRPFRIALNWRSGSAEGIGRLLPPMLLSSRPVDQRSDAVDAVGPDAAAIAARQCTERGLIVDATRMVRPFPRAAYDDQRSGGSQAGQESLGPAP